MLPILTILIIAGIGAFVDGLAGFLSWGFAAFIGVMVLGWIVKLLSGGLMPRKVRDQVATDFIAAHSDLVEKSSPIYSAYELKERVASLLEQMMAQSTANASMLNVGSANSAAVFIPSALSVANEQSSDLDFEIAHALVTFTTSHPLLFGRN